MANVNYFQNIDFNKNQAINFVLHNCTSTTRPTNPVGGQRIYEVDTGLAYTYNAVKGAWESSSGAITFKGVVGGTSQGALANLPDSPNLQDAYYVGADGDYGPTGETQHANVGDFFFCNSEKTSTANAKWSLVPSGNGRLESEITIASGTTSYTTANSLGTTAMQVTLFDEDGNIVYAGVKVDTANITVELSDTSATTLAGKKLTLVACVG